jgi:hypothetical protein
LDSTAGKVLRKGERSTRKYIAPNIPEKKAHYNNIKERNIMTAGLIRTCKRCGKEVGKLRRYCDECRKTQIKENWNKSQGRPEAKERRKRYYLEYYKQEENLKKRKEYNHKYHAMLKEKDIPSAIKDGQ